MSGSKEILSAIDESVKAKVKLGNDHQILVMGKGSISIRTKKGEEKEIPT